MRVFNSITMSYVPSSNKLIHLIISSLTLKGEVQGSEIKASNLIFLFL